ncbi:MAG TPA: tRNA-dihydrouridine synthase, partial [Rectinemataceae bacterium]
LDFCSALAAAGADFLTIHPRTDSQKLRRKPRWELIARLAADLSLPIVANGDIRSSDDVSALLKEGASAVMIGREAARKPWVFSVLHSASAGSIDALAVGIRFLELADTLLPPPWRKPSSRRFFEYYCEQFSFAHHVRCSLASSSDSQAAKAVLADYFAQVPSDRFIEIGPRS